MKRDKSDIWYAFLLIVIIISALAFLLLLGIIADSYLPVIEYERLN